MEGVAHGGGVARRPPRARQADLPLRLATASRSPARRSLSLHRGRGAALRGLRLARADGRRTATTSTPIARAIAAAQAGRGPALARDRAHADRLRQPQAGHASASTARRSDADAGRRDEEASSASPRTEPFFVPEEALRALPRRRSARPGGRGGVARRGFDAYARPSPTSPPSGERVMAGELPAGWDADLPRLRPRPTSRSRRARPAGKVLERARRPACPSSSAARPTSIPRPRRRSRAPATSRARTPRRTRQGAVGGEWGYGGRNLHFGVREHAMGAIASGLALHGGLVPFTATFLDLRRLHAPVDPPRRADGAARRLRLHARQHRRGRGRPDPPARRAARPRCGPSPTSR